MNDRLLDLRPDSSTTFSPLASSAGGTSNPVAENAAGDLEMGTKATNRRGSQFASADFMQNFFHQVDGVKADIYKIKDASKKIHELHHNMLLATTTDAESSISNELNQVIDSSNRVAKRCKQTLKDLDDQTQLMKESNKLQGGELRIRENLVNTLRRKLMENINLYQKRQQEYKDGVKDKVSRQVRIVKEDATDEEIQEVMNSSGGAGELFKSAILTNAADPVREAYEKAQDKYQDVRRLEASVLELHQMFVDFALLTEQQGELLDQIEYQIQAAGDFIETGNEDIAVAIEYQKSIRKKQCCVLLIVLVIIGAIVGQCPRIDRVVEVEDKTSTTSQGIPILVPSPTNHEPRPELSS